MMIRGLRKSTSSHLGAEVTKLPRKALFGRFAADADATPGFRKHDHHRCTLFPAYWSGCRDGGEGRDTGTSSSDVRAIVHAGWLINRVFPRRCDCAASRCRLGGNATTPALPLSQAVPGGNVSTIRFGYNFTTITCCIYLRVSLVLHLTLT